MNKIILASQSPRRLEILRKHGIEPIVMPTDADETLPEKIGMEAAVEMLAGIKATACYEAVCDDPEYSDALIIGADTIVYKNGIMGKPENAADAFRMLSSIRNTFHYVVTGVAVINVQSGAKTILSDVTKVFCRNYADEDILDYIEEAKPYDKAGSYAIQGSFGKYIDHIEGDYENVVGLPYYRIADMLK